MMFLLPRMMEALGLNLSIFELAARLQSMALSSYAGDCTQTGMLAMLLAMLSAAGGDQKKQSCVIPLCAGMKRETYIYSKFIVYPVTAGACGFFGYWLAYLVSFFLFEVKVPLGEAAMLALALAAFSIFVCSVMLFLGCSTGKAGISAVILFFALTIVGSVLTMLERNQYNPLALQSILTGVSSPIDLPNYLTGLLTALILWPLLALAAAQIFKRKKII